MTRGIKIAVAASVAILVAVAALLIVRFHPSHAAQEASRIKVVDDFNEGADPNLIGGESFTNASAGAVVTSSFIRTSTPGDGDRACQVTYQLATGTGAMWGTGLNELDISAATTLQFWLRLSDPVPELRVELVDGDGARSDHQLEGVRANGRWQRVSIPTSAFARVNFNRLARFVLRMRTSTDTIDGSLTIDDLAFHGPPAVFFESLKDNVYAFPDRALTDARPLLAMPSREMLMAVARDTWGYFRDLVDRRHHLPINYIQIEPERRLGDYASTTDIAMYLMSVISAQDLDFIDYPSAVNRVRDTLTTLSHLPSWRGLYYNYYSTTNLQVTRHYISSVDNGWLAAALVVVRQAYPELALMASSLLEPMEFEALYDPKNGQMRLGYEAQQDRISPNHYGLLATEARIISMVAIGKGDVPEQHWFRMFRTLPGAWDWQTQIPKGRYVTYHGFDVFQGYYTYSSAGGEDVAFVPSWGGSLFEFLMPTLVVDERRLAPHGLGLNNQRAVELHIRYALQERGYPVWGLSPCATPNERHGGYSEFGVTALGSKGYKDEATVTPHVSFLALPVAPKEAEANIRRLISGFTLYGPYGLYDAVDVKTGEVALRYLALDQGMSLIALNNFLNDGAIQRRFAEDPLMARMGPLLAMERFFEENTIASLKESR